MGGAGAVAGIVGGGGGGGGGAEGGIGGAIVCGCIPKSGGNGVSRAWGCGACENCSAGGIGGSKEGNGPSMFDCNCNGICSRIMGTMGASGAGS